MALDSDTLFRRIQHAVDRRAYFTPTTSLPAEMREALDEVRAALAAPHFDAGAVRTLISALHEQGRIDRIRMLSALVVVASHPSVADHAEAGRLCGEQEVAVLQAGGPQLDQNLAAVDRHRGVTAFHLHQPDVALEHFTRAFERHRTAENLGNVLAALCKRGDLDEADRVVDQAHEGLPAAFVRELDAQIARDPDLAPLRFRESA